MQGWLMAWAHASQAAKCSAEAAGCRGVQLWGATRHAPGRVIHGEGDSESAALSCTGSYMRRLHAVIVREHLEASDGG